MPEALDTSGGWTVDTLKVHQEQLRAADDRFYTERDRRYTEVAQEREKALKIKEQADRDALDLARDIQQYKDEKANELREQISSERGLYVTQNDLKGAVDKIEATIAPLVSFVTSQQGQRSGQDRTVAVIVGAFGLAVTALTIVGLIIGLTR